MKKFIPSEDLIELGPDGEWPAFYHAEDCQGWCEYACGGEFCNTEEELGEIAFALHHAEAVRLLERVLEWSEIPSDEPLGGVVHFAEDIVPDIAAFLGSEETTP